MSVEINEIRNGDFYNRDRKTYVTHNNLRAVYYQAKIGTPIAGDM
jgi:hypothetical protein